MRSLVVTHIDVFGSDPNGSTHAIKTLAYRLAERTETIIYCTRAEAKADPGGTVKVVSGSERKLGAFQTLLRTRLDNFLVRNLRFLFNSVFEALISYKKKKNGLEKFRNERKLGEFERFLESSKPFDLIVVEYIQNAYLLDGMSSSRAITAIDTHDIMYRRADSFLSCGVAPALIISKEQELAVLRQFDFVLAIQSDDARILRDELNTEVLSVPRPQDVRASLDGLQLESSVGRLRCLFFASKAIFNAHALCWFIDNVWSDELAQRYELIVGGAICDVLPRKVTKKVRLIGRVASAGDAYMMADIVLNPIKMGSGLKIKNLEAMAFGKPVITTSLGVEGITREEGRGIWVVNEPSGFRELLMHLSDHPYEIQRMGQSAREFVRDHFDANTCFSEFDEMVAGVIEGCDT